MPPEFVTARSPWWKGARGEWLVVIQFVLMATLLFGPRSVSGLPAWPAPLASTVVGIATMAAGAVLLAAGGRALRLANALTALPAPKECASLVCTGPFAVVRHPIYSGSLVVAFGWALLVHGWLTLGYVLLIFVFLDVKSRHEERWLVQKFPEYREYQQRVRKLIPFVY